MLPLQGLHGLFKNRAILVTPSLLVYILDLLFGEWKFSSFCLNDCGDHPGLSRAWHAYCDPLFYAAAR